MGVNPVSGYGNITSGNAKEIYIAWKHGEVELEVSQQKYCESFLSESDWDEINYDMDSKQSEGKDKVGDAEKADAHGDQTGNAAAMTVGNFAAIGAMSLLIKVHNGFSQLALSLIGLAFALVQKTLAGLFDNAYKDRKEAKNNAGNTNGIIDEQTGVLEDSMDSMNEDMATYNTAVQAYTEAMNGNNSELANLQVSWADAEVAGDTEGAAQIREEIRALQKAGQEMDTSEMDNQRAKIQEYQALGDESYGVSDGGASVAKFLRGGYDMAPWAFVNAGLNLAAAGWVAGIVPIPKIAPFFPDAPASGIAKGVLLTQGAAYLGAAGIWGEKAIKELECGSAGSDMQTHVDSLNGMIEQQSGYVESTTGEYDNMDAESKEAIEKGKEKANSNSAANGGNPTDSKPPKAGEGNPFSPTASKNVTT